MRLSCDAYRRCSIRMRERSSQSPALFVIQVTVAICRSIFSLAQFKTTPKQIPDMPLSYSMLVTFGE